MRQVIHERRETGGPVPAGPSLDADFLPFVPVGAAISALLYPHAEVAIHDLRTDRIGAIWNSFSRRVAGDPSLLGDITAELDAGQVFGPYDKADPGGSRLKSVSAVLTDGAGRKVGLLCINFDVSELDGALAAVQSFVSVSQARPPLLFRNDYREAVNVVLRDFLTARSLSLAALTRQDRVELVAEFKRRGLFEQRKAADHIAAALGIARATVYALLAAGRRAPDGPR